MLFTLEKTEKNENGKFVTTSETITATRIFGAKRIATKWLNETTKTAYRDVKIILNKDTFLERTRIGTHLYKWERIYEGPVCKGAIWGSEFYSIIVDAGKTTIR